MKIRKLMWAGLLAPAFGVATSARDVPPGFLGESVTGAQSAAAAGTAAGTAAAGAAGKGGLCKLAECLRQCREKMCQKPCGKMINGMFKPISLMTGGTFGNFCPDSLSKETIDKMEPGAEKTAAEVQAAEAGAGERRAAIRYLATADCHWYPKVGAQIAELMRSDTVECVRLEAASALLTGCCCNKDTITALKNVITCEPKDEFPTETSGRVQWVAYQALNKCLACYVDKPEEEKKDPPKKAQPKDTKAAKGGMTSTEGMVPRHDGKATQVAYRSNRESMAQAVAEARQAMREYEARNMKTGVSPTSGERSLLASWSRAGSSYSMKPIAIERVGGAAPAIAMAPGESRVLVSETIVPKNAANGWSNNQNWAKDSSYVVTSAPSTKVVTAAPVVAKPTYVAPVTSPVVAAKPAAPTRTIVESPAEPTKRSLYSMMFQGRSGRTTVVESAPVQTYSKAPQSVKPTVVAAKPIPAVGTSKPTYTYPAATTPSKSGWKPNVVEPAATNAYVRPAQLARPVMPNVQQTSNVKPIYQPVEVIESATFSEPAGAPMPQAGANYPRGL